MEAIDSAIDPLRDFAKSSVRLVQRCHKPDRKGTPISKFLSSDFDVNFGSGDLDF